VHERRGTLRTGTAAVLAAAVLAAGSVVGGSLAAGSLAAGSAPAAGTGRPAPVRPGAGRDVRLRLTLERRLASTTKPPTTSQCEREYGSPCYRPAQIQTAYDEAPLLTRGITGAGETIVLVDCFGSPTIRRDLATFDARFGLPAPPSLRVIQPAGRVPRYDPATSTMVGWAAESTLDVEWSHAVAPGASLLLVETPVSETEGTSGFAQIVEAENDVIDHHLGDVISQSFGASEESFPSPSDLLGLRSAYVNAARHGVTVLAAAGDTGPTGLVGPHGTTLSTSPAVTWPASDPLVTAVGSTQLTLDAAGAPTAPDRAWNDTYGAVFTTTADSDPGPTPAATGGGRSAVFARPAYQDGVAAVVGDHRGVPDVSMSGSCSDPVETYESFGGQAPGWYLTCGTSESTPLFAGIVALADQVAHRSLGLINPALYALAADGAPGIVDVTLGTTTVSFSQTGMVHTVRGFAAGPGYNLATGVGTVDAALFVPELAAAVAGSGTYNPAPAPS
jgi:subtilase family serine protease